MDAIREDALSKQVDKVKMQGIGRIDRFVEDNTTQTIF